MPDEKAIFPKNSETIGLLIAIYLLVLTTVLVGGAGVLWVRSSKPSKAEASACWRIQEAAGRVFKLNACTGETIEIVPQRPANTGARTTMS
jgi:hypothetical protein